MKWHILVDTTVTLGSGASRFTVGRTTNGE